MRAAEGGEDATFIQQLDRTKVDFLIAAHGVHERLFIAGETRRIEDDQIVFGFRLLEEIEEILIEADVGVKATIRLIDSLRESLEIA